MPNLLDPYNRDALTNALYLGPVGSERVGGDTQLTMPSADVSPTVGWYGAHPQTEAGRADAMRLAGNMLQFGPADVGAISLAQIHPRTLRPLSSAPDLGKSGNHAYSILGHDGEPVGIVDTAWNPDTGNLHIADIQSNEGANSLGPGAMRQVRDLLVARYPDAKTLTGQRITGAVSADTMSGAGPGRAASQNVNVGSVHAPIEISAGHITGQLPIVRFNQDAAAIQDALPPVADGLTRLWRGNRPDEVGHNPSFTNSLPGIALPFREAYGGPLSYVDVPSADLSQYMSTGGVAPGAEFHLPPTIARQAQVVHVKPRDTQ